MGGAADGGSGAEGMEVEVMDVAALGNTNSLSLICLSIVVAIQAVLVAYLCRKRCQDQRDMNYLRSNVWNLFGKISEMEKKKIRPTSQSPVSEIQRNRWAKTRIRASRTVFRYRLST